ncbi:MAG: cupin domain-containing protein [Thermoplasmata archaeon]
MFKPELSMLPSQAVWKEQPALARGATFAVFLGDLTQPGKYVFRLRAPAGHRVLPHRHPDERVYTVLAGTFYLGFGHDFSAERLREYPEGSVVLVREGRHHFQEAKSEEYVVQIEGDGPTSVEYLNPANDPRGIDRPA